MSVIDSNFPGFASAIVVGVVLAVLVWILFAVNYLYCQGNAFPTLNLTSARAREISACDQAQGIELTWA